MSEDIPFYNMDGYNKFFFCRESGRGGGVLVFVSKRLFVKNVVNDLFSTAESVCFDVVCKERHLTVGAVYRPPNTDIDCFLVDLQKFFASHEQVCLPGDINLDYLYPSSSADLCLILKSFDMLMPITSPTRSASNSLLDHLYTNALVKNSGVFDPQVSDHLAVECTLATPKFFQKTFELVSTDLDQLAGNLMMETWESVYSCSDINLAYYAFLLTMSHLDRVQRRKVVRVGRRGCLIDDKVYKAMSSLRKEKNSLKSRPD